MNRKILHTPEGLRDIYGAECEKKKQMEERLCRVMTSYGYRDIETPSFEFFDVFGSDIGTIPSRDLYKFFDREGNTLVLRPDFTPSIARAASRYFSQESGPVRLCYRGQAFVSHSSHQGRLNETTQLGAELIGEGRTDADAEVIAMATEMLLKAGLTDFQISIGQVRFYESLVREAGIEGDMAAKLRLLVHNRNTFGVEQLLTGLSIEEKYRRILTLLPTLVGGAEVIDRALELSEGTGAQESAQRLKEVLELLKVYGLEKQITVDFGMLSNYMYYTGLIFRGYTYGTGEAIVKGGRYDGLLKHFGHDAPSTGFVLVVDQLMNALERQKIETGAGEKRCLILYEAQGSVQAHALAKARRSEGGIAELVRLPEDAEKAQAVLAQAEERERDGLTEVIRV